MTEAQTNSYEMYSHWSDDHHQEHIRKNRHIQNRRNKVRRKTREYDIRLQNHIT